VVELIASSETPVKLGELSAADGRLVLVNPKGGAAGP